MTYTLFWLLAAFVSAHVEDMGLTIICSAMCIVSAIRERRMK